MAPGSPLNIGVSLAYIISAERRLQLSREALAAGGALSKNPRVFRCKLLECVVARLI